MSQMYSLGDKALVGELNYTTLNPAVSGASLNVLPLTLNKINNRVGINQLVPKTALDVQGQIGVGVTRYAGTGNANAPVFAAYLARGTQDVPLAVQAGDYLFTLGARPFNGVFFPASSSAYISAKANENHTTIAHGTNLVFATVADGTTPAVERMILSNAGNFGIGTLAPTQKLEVSGTAKATNIHLSNTFISDTTLELTGTFAAPFQFPAVGVPSIVILNKQSSLTIYGYSLLASTVSFTLQFPFINAIEKVSLIITAQQLAEVAGPVVAVNLVSSFVCPVTSFSTAYLLVEVAFSAPITLAQAQKINVMILYNI